MRRQSLTLAITAATLVACQSVPKADNFAQIELSFEWPQNAACFGHSPEIRLNNVPEGAAILEFKLRDFNASFNHGGGTIAYTGSNTIPEAALKNYAGPCPPAGQVHTYEISVIAYSADKAIALGEGASTRRYPE